MYFFKWPEEKLIYWCLLDLVRHLLFFLFAISCQVIHSNSQEDVQQDVWAQVDVKGTV